MIHLDTNFLIGALARGSPESARLRAWLSAGETVSISAVAWAEYLCGPVSAADVSAAARLLRTPVPLTGAEAATGAQLFNTLGRRRHALPDCLVAATAIRAGASLATVNVSDFQPLVPAGLQLAT